MKIKGLALSAAVAGVLAIGGLLVASQVFAASGTIKIDSGTAAVGEDGLVDLNALDVTSPGLGAWTIDINYDPDVVTATACSAAQGGVCNAEYADDQVRITGAVAEGLEGDSFLGSVTFECGDAAGESPLDVSTFTFSDGTLGGPLPIDETVVSGTFTCTAEAPPQLPSTGVGDSSDGNLMTWVIASLAVVGLASMAAYGALRVRTNRA
jgi:hypothetical protein